MAPPSRNDLPTRGRSALARLRALPPELRNAGIASAALVLSLLLPWYEKSVFLRSAKVFVSANLSAFGVFSWVEAAVLLVAAGVVGLIWARADRRAFHLPGGDGTVILAAGAWAFGLLVWRLFDKPDAQGDGATVGIQWGIFGAMAAAAALAAAGARIRAVGRPEPPNPAEEEDWEAAPPARRRTRRDPADATAVTEVLRDRPRWQGEPPEPPRGARPPAGPDAPGAVADEPGDPPHDRLF